MLIQSFTAIFTPEQPVSTCIQLQHLPLLQQVSLQNPWQQSHMWAGNISQSQSLFWPEISIYYSYCINLNTPYKHSLMNGPVSVHHQPLWASNGPALVLYGMFIGSFIHCYRNISLKYTVQVQHSSTRLKYRQLSGFQTVTHIYPESLRMFNSE